MGTKYDRLQKLKNDEIENKFQFYKIIQTKKNQLKIIRTKSKEKTNWRAVVKFWKASVEIEEEREKKKK